MYEKMVAQNIKKNLLMIFLLLFLAIAPFYKLLFSSGIVATGDIVFPWRISQISDYVKAYIYSWNPYYHAGMPYVADPSGNLIFALSLTFLGILFPMSMAGTVWLIFWLFLAGVSMYYMTYKLIEKRAASLVAAIYYMLTPYFTDIARAGFRSHIMAYAIVPLSISLYMRSIRSRSYLTAIKAGVIFAILMSLALQPTILVFLSMIIYLLIYFLPNIIHFRRNKEFKSDALKSFLLVIIIGFSLNMFWIIPYLYRLTVTGALHWYSDTIEGVIVSSNLLGGFANVIINDSPPYFRGFVLRAQNWLTTIHYIGAITLTFLVFIPLLFKQRKREVLFFSCLSVISLILAGGTIGPLGSSYLWLFLHIPGFIIFNRPLFFFNFISLSYAFLLGAFMSTILDKLQSIKLIVFSIVYHNGSTADIIRLQPNKQRLKWIASFLIILLILSQSWPMLTGNFVGHIKTIDFPEEHKNVASWLKTENGDYRILLILPYDAGQFSWFPTEGDDVPSTALYPPFNNPIVEYPPKPIITLGWGLPTPNQLSLFAINAMYLNRSAYIGKILGLLGVKYIVISLDQLDVSGWSPLYSPWQNTTTLFNNILPHLKGLKQVWHEGKIYVYENEYALPHLFTSQGIGVVFGDMRTLLSLASIDNFDFQRIPLVFSSQTSSCLLYTSPSPRD